MQEKIGNITLDYEFYPGEDLYCDGAIENTLLDIVKKHEKHEYSEIIKNSGSWPILYHLSELRGNIVKWIPMDKNAKVLEVGSGCGAITGTLAEKAGSVTCVDLSKKRSYINAHRNKEKDNVFIHVGNFKDIEPTLDNDYDYVMLIGVFEYGQAYIGGEHPYEEFMRILLRHLKPDGRLVIAIENKFGLKYWAGCREDHLATFFSGLEGYKDGGVVRTFTRKGLEKIFKRAGVSDYHFYYPYPDYKFMHTLYSDRSLPKKGELTLNKRNYDRDRLQLFDETAVFDSIIEDEEFALFSNSYLVVIGADVELSDGYYSDMQGVEFLEEAGNMIGNAIVDVCAGARMMSEEERKKYRVQLYFDYGQGFSEENSVFLNNVYQNEEEIAFTYQIPENVKQLRIDPASFSCMLTIRELSIDGKAVKKGQCRHQGKKIGKNSWLFATDDPGILVKYSGGGCLKAEFDCVRLSGKAAERMAD